VRPGRHLGMLDTITHAAPPIYAEEFAYLRVLTPYGELWLLVDGDTWAWGGETWLWPWARTPEA